MAFLQATIEGWTYAIQHPDEAVTDTLNVNLNLDRNHQTRMFAATVDLIQPGAAPVGTFDADKWSRMYKMMLDSGLLKTALDINKAYDKSFIEKIGGGKP
jgi:ABC-type nitrate/sulfonate/bicarbonate transport system substrate-binding protein